RGLRRAAELGADTADAVGYLPDMFGHVAQMPQLLRLAGIEHAVVWRGVPHAGDRTAFWWRAPDGSVVRAEYLYGSYANGRDLPPDPALLLGRADGYAAGPRDALLPTRATPLTNGRRPLRAGGARVPPPPVVPAVVAAANRAQSRYRFAIRRLGDHVRSGAQGALASWDGELRSGARANLLMGVASNRVDVHQLAAR